MRTDYRRAEGQPMPMKWKRRRDLRDRRAQALCHFVVCRVGGRTALQKPGLQSSGWPRSG
jgi:hypothetical protein